MRDTGCAGSTEFDHEAQLFACARGDATALRRLYDHEARWLMSIALRIVQRRELADEVLHDAFLRIWQKAGSYSPTLGTARGWIYSVVRNCALDVVRAGQREMPMPDLVIEDVRDDSDGPLDNLSRASDALALHRCLQHLDAQKRTCILLAYLDGYSHTQIATALARPLGTVKAWTRRGLRSIEVPSRRLPKWTC